MRRTLENTLSDAEFLARGLASREEARRINLECHPVVQSTTFRFAVGDERKLKLVL